MGWSWESGSAFRVVPGPRRGTAPPGSGWCRLRDPSHIWGLPNLSARAQLACSRGNAQLKFCLSLIRTCCRLRIPVALENPGTSWVWQVPQLDRLCKRVDSQPRQRSRFLCLRRPLAQAYQGSGLGVQLSNQSSESVLWPFRSVQFLAKAAHRFHRSGQELGQTVDACR